MASRLGVIETADESHRLLAIHSIEQAQAATQREELRRMLSES
jgi:hypothetical protein